jgi:hypothetical protein
MEFKLKTWENHLKSSCFSINILGHYELVLFVPSKIHEKKQNFHKIRWKTRKNNIKTHKNSQYKHKNQWEILRQYDSYLNEPSKVELFVSFGVQFKLKYCRISP